MAESPRRRPLGRLATVAWVLNVAGIGALFVVFALYRAAEAGRAGPPTLPAIGEVGSASATPVLALAAGSTPLPDSAAANAVSPTPFVAPGGLRPEVIGRSVRGRPIEVYRFGHGDRTRMIVAGIHGGYESNTIRLADELISYFADHSDSVPANATLYVLRSLNPDGEVLAHSVAGRTNDRGVDLNRNFPVNWEPEWDRSGCWDYAATTAGAEPGSEPETRAVMSFLLTHPVDVLISYHSAALGVFPGGEPWQPESMRFAAALSEITGYPYPPIDTSCHYTGTLADYAASRGIVAVDMELANHIDTDFDANLEAMELLLRWTSEKQD